MTEASSSESAGALPEDDSSEVGQEETDKVDAPEDSDDVALVRAVDLDHGTGVRRVYGGLSFTIPEQSLAVLLGGDGSGKSLLLLALIGRTRPIGGSLRVAGLDAYARSRALRKISTAARIGSFVDLEPRHSVRDARRDRAAFEGLGDSDAERRYSEACDALQLKVPDESLIEDLSRLQQTQLTLALAAQQSSNLIVLDDADRGLNLADQDQLYRSIDALIDSTGSTVVVTSVEPESIPDHAARIPLPAPGSVDPRHSTATQSR